MARKQAGKASVLAFRFDALLGLMDLAYYHTLALIHIVKGYEAKTAEGKVAWGKDNRKKSARSKNLLPRESHRNNLPPPAVTCDYTYMLFIKKDFFIGSQSRRYLLYLDY